MKATKSGNKFRSINFSPHYPITPVKLFQNPNVTQNQYIFTPILVVPMNDLCCSWNSVV